jgi:SAM-dependent methyltransferase
MAYQTKVEAKMKPGVQAVMRTETGELPHFCYPLVDPRWVAAKDAAHMRADDPVLGFEFGGAAWALPWWIMKNHHIANLELGGRPLLVTLCEACSSGAAFDPVIDGKRYTFRLEGLYNGTIMPIDHETNSRWTGFTGESIQGAMKGKVMERLSLFQCTWQEWLELHPDTLVPDGKGESRTGHGEGHFPGGPIVAPRFRALLSHIDARLPHYELVLGVMAGAAARAYPLAALEKHGRVLNERLGEAEIVVFSRPGTWMAGAYERSVDGRTLTFRSEGEAIFDEETGSRWEISGRAAAGPLAGRQLKYVHSGVEEFHIWGAFHPGTEVFGETLGAAVPWSGDGAPLAVRETLESSWWTPGMDLLDIGCGNGLVAAWAAESTLKAIGVDIDAARIAHARRSFGRLPGLRFEVADITAAGPRKPRFSALYDAGLYFRLAPAQRAAYLENVAAVSKSGARFLLLARVAPAGRARLVEETREALKAHFHFVDARPTELPKSAAGGGSAGVALRFLRGGWLA